MGRNLFIFLEIVEEKVAYKKGALQAASTFLEVAITVSTGEHKVGDGDTIIPLPLKWLPLNADIFEP